MMKTKSIILFPLLLLPILAYSEPDSLKKAKAYVDSAQTYIEKALNITENSPLPAASKLTAKLYFYQGKFEESAKILESVNRECPNDTVALKFLAQLYYLEGHYTKSLELLNRLQNIVSDPEVFYFIAKIYEKRKCWDEAASNYKKIINIAKSGSEYYENAWERVRSLEKSKEQVISEENRNFIESLIPNRNYPDAKALILLHEESYNIKEELTVFQLHRIIKILTAEGIEKFGKAELLFDNTYEEIEVKFAKIIQPDGSVFEVSPKSFLVTSPFASYTSYSNNKNFIILFPELQVGSVIDYTIVRRTINPYNHVWKNMALQSKEPIMLQKYRIEYPADFNLKTKCVGVPTILKQEVKRDRCVVNFELKERPGVLHESYMPPINEIIPHFLLSSFKSWDEVYAWWRNLYIEQIELDSRVRETVHELIQRINNPYEKAKSIYEFVALNIRYVAISYGKGGYKPRKVTEIHRTRYGDCKDQALLLVAMLREAKIEAYPCLIGVELMPLDENFSSLQFNHCIALAKINDKYIFMDPTKGTCPFGYIPSSIQDKKAMVFEKNMYKFLKTPLFSPEVNKEIRNMKIMINNNKSIDVDKEGIHFGEKEILLRKWFRSLRPTIRKEILEREISSFCPGGRLVYYSIINLDSISLPFSITEKFYVPHWLKDVGDNKLSFKLPTVVINIKGTEKEERRYPIDYRHTESKEYHIKIELPEGLKPVLIPESLKMNNKYASFSYQSEYQDKEISITLLYSRKATRIPLKDYKEWKSFAEGIKRKLEEKIILTQ